MNADESNSLSPDASPLAAPLGHDAIFDALRRTVDRNRLASTYLFVGDEGVGKRTAAHFVAAALLCSASDDRDLAPCGVCASCELIAAGNHPDLLTVARPDGKATLPVDLFIGAGDKRNREGLCHDIALKPMLGARRIAIIDDADHLSVESGNCLLKTLEEPPPASLIVLIATSPQRVLPTIRSRSQVMRFGLLDDATVAKVLRQTEAATDDAAALQLATAGRGSVTRALAAADEELLAISPEICKALSGVDLDPVALAAQVQERIAAGSPDPALKRRRLRGVVDIAIEQLRSDLRTAPHPEATLRRLDACLDTQQHIDRNANPSTLVPWWLDQMWLTAPARA